MVTTKWHYAQTVNQQINPNLTKRNKWSNVANAVGYSTNYATANFTTKTSTTKDKNGKKETVVTTSNYPYTLTAHDFRLDIPANAYIKKVEIQVRMKASDKKTGVEFPRGLVCIYGVGWSKHLDNTKGRETGWYNGLYFVNPKKDLSTSFDTYTYTVKGDNITKAGYTAGNLNSTVAGIDLVFDDEKLTKNVSVHLRWVGIRVTYDIPTYTLVHNGASTSESNPRHLTTGRNYNVRFTLSQSTKAKGGNQCLKLTVPFGTTFNPPIISKGTFNTDTNIWTVNCNGVTTATMDLPFKDYTVDTQAITLSPVNCSGTTEPHPPKRDFWYESGFGGVDDYGEIQMSVSSNPHKRHTMCFYVSSKVTSTVDREITLNFAHQSGFQYDTVGSQDNILNVEIYPQLTSDGVEFVSCTTNSATFRLPELNEVYDLCFTYCLRPTVKGDFESVCVLAGGLIEGHCPFTVGDPYEYHFGTKTVFDEENNIANYLLNGEVIGFLNHRIASELETGAYVLPCRVAEHDSLMKQSKPNIHMYKWEQLDYIGCVPLEHLHFDPKSTYKDKLLDTHYKNKRYMGKELASDEDITLNVRLHPQQVTTIQGLIDMDKPIPVNANHRCFEGDSLNHRGWCEIYGVTTTLTNPNWYKCDIDVKYLTHNLNTRFKINKGDKTFDKYEMPSLLLESVTSGDALSDFGQDDENVGNQTDYFKIDTDGGYIYNSEEIDTSYYLDDEDKIVFYVDSDTAYMIPDIIREYGEDNVDIIQGTSDDDYNALIEQITEEGYYIISADFGKPIVVDDTIYSNTDQRNIFSLEEGQHFSIKSRDTLSDVAQITYNWSTQMIDENKENAISKIIRLINKEDNLTMFEYEYSDFDFSEYVSGDNHITVHVIGRAYRKGDYDEVINEDIRIPIIVDDDEEEDSTESGDTETEILYGSSVSFRLNNHVLRVLDSGYTGNVLDKSNIELEGESYYYEVEWKNNNTDGETGEVITYVDLTVQDSLLATQYSSKYGNLVVSPFPVADKTMVFNRNAEEGTLYYYNDDKEEFSFLIEPYYQYFNGVDLRASVDDESYISIFNLNYGYKTVYLENGLVSLGIDRLNGQMYLRKWDNDSKRYISLFTFQLENYDDVNINSISDDKIELQASNTLISMYRGHPYVILKHGLEDIRILSKFNKVWAEQVDDDIMDYPTYFDLLNNSNILPACVGGTKTIDDDCVEVFECGDPDTVECPDLSDVSIAMNLATTIYEDEETTLDITTEDLDDGDIVYFIIDGDVLDDKPMTYPTPVPYTFDENKEYEVSAVFVGDDDRSYAIASTVTIHAKQRIPDDSGDDEQEEGGTVDCPKPASGTYKLTINSPKTFKYLDGQTITYTLTRGGKPVCGKTVEKTDFTRIHSNPTKPNGTVTSTNSLVSYVPAKYKIGARFFEGGEQLCKSEFIDVVIKKADLEWVFQKAGSVNHNVVFTLRDKDTKRPIANTQVTVAINGKLKTKKTNSQGQVKWKIKSKDKYNYKCVFAGNKYYNKKSKSFKEVIK